MNTYDTDSIRNIALAGHSSSGKTSLAEAMLYTAGETNRLGTITDGTTKSDHTEAEIDRQISISTSVLHCAWNDTRINILDTPGYPDFIGDAKAGLWAVDAALILINAASGVEVGTDKAWAFCRDYGRPVFFFINHMGKEFANFEKVLGEMQEHFGRGIVPFHLPANPGAGFNQIMDGQERRLLTYQLGGKGKADEGDVPAELESQAGEVQERIIEAAAESEDALTEKYLEEGGLSEEEVSRGIKIGIANRTLFPVLCGDASGNIGADRLLDFLVAKAPAPLEVPPRKAYKPDSEETIELAPKAEAPMAAIVFKTISESVGDLSFVRVVSGTLAAGGDAFNANLKENERIGQVYLLNGKDKEEVEALSPGDIGALVKLKNTHTRDTLCAKNAPAIVSPYELPHPLIRIGMQPKSRGDEDKISTGLQRIHEEDPCFLAGYDPELRQIIVEGQGELHLDVVIQKLKGNFGVDVEVIEPKIPYRETITGNAEGHHRHKKQTGGRGQFGEVYVRVASRGRGEGCEFEDKVVGGSIPSKYIPAVEKGVVEAMERGVLAGYQVVDTQVTVYDGSFHNVDSSDMAFKMAGSQAFQKAFMDSKPILLEPIYELEATVTEKYVGDVMGDLSSRRGRIQGIDTEGSFQLIRAEVPLAELYKYSTSLRSMTQGTGDYTMSFSRFEPVPLEVTQKVVAASKEEKEAVEV